MKAIVHEMGHAIEENYRKGGNIVTKEFLKMRIKEAGTPTVKLKNALPGRGYGANEIGNKDGFEKLYGKESGSVYYAGKSYSFGGTELTSMGMEQLAKDPTGFARRDPEFFKFTMGTLRGKWGGGG